MLLHSITCLFSLGVKKANFPLRQARTKRGEGELKCGGGGGGSCSRARDLVRAGHKVKQFREEEEEEERGRKQAKQPCSQPCGRERKSEHFFIQPHIFNVLLLSLLTSIIGLWGGGGLFSSPCQ